MAEWEKEEGLTTEGAGDSERKGMREKKKEEERPPPSAAQTPPPQRGGGEREEDHSPGTLWSCSLLWSVIRG